jgi:MFS family permease
MTIDTPKPASNRSVILLVIVAALGYFVDLYDLVLFGVVRIPSLKSLGLEGDELTNVGLHLLNWQMAGMLVGGFAWGVLGDKRGRVSVLYGSILTYSLANLANAFVHDVETYALLRFIAGFGLAGELGAGITLVMESMPAKTRGWGTTVIATFGVLGGATAAFFRTRLCSIRLFAFLVVIGVVIVFVIIDFGFHLTH